MSVCDKIIFALRALPGHCCNLFECNALTDSCRGLVTCGQVAVQKLQVGTQRAWDLFSEGAGLAAATVYNSIQGETQAHILALYACHLEPYSPAQLNRMLPQLYISKHCKRS